MLHILFVSKKCWGVDLWRCLLSLWCKHKGRKGEEKNMGEGEIQNL